MEFLLLNKSMTVLIIWNSRWRKNVVKTRLPSVFVNFQQFCVIIKFCYNNNDFNRFNNNNNNICNQTSQSRVRVLF